MSSNTPYTNLLKEDPIADGKTKFSIKTMLNENWDKIDAKLAEKSTQVSLNATNLNVINNTNMITSNTQSIANNAKAIASVASGSPRNTYATLVLLQSAFPSGNAYIYLVASNGNWYYWNSLAWVSGGIYQAIDVANKSIIPEKLSFMDISSNLFNEYDFVAGMVLPIGSGTPIVNVNYQLSNYIVIEPLTSYTELGILRMTFFDASYIYISGANDPNPGSSPFIFSTPINAKYMRLSVINTNADLAQINKGTALLTYEKFYQTVNKSSLPELGENEIIPEETTIFDISTNYFCTQNITLGTLLLGGSATPSLNVDYQLCDYTEVKQLTKYTLVGIEKIAFFNAKKEYLGWKGRADYNPMTLTTPKFTTFVRISILNVDLNIAQMNEGNVLLAYKKGYKYVNQKLINFPVVAPSNTSFFDTPTNLFNPNNVSSGMILSSGSDVPTANSGYQLSDYINVKSSVKYTLIGVVRITFLNSRLEYISEISRADYNALVVLVPSLATYARLSIQNVEASSAQMNNGSALLPYADGTPKLKDWAFKTNGEITQINDTYKIDVPIDGVFDTVEVFGNYTDFYTRSASSVYALFDALMTTYPEYITRAFLGNEVTGLPVYVYYLTPLMPTTSIQPKMTKVFLTCGTHGIEKASTLSTYLMIKQMCEKWTSYPLLEALRFNVKFIIMPIVNPWGWNNGSRINSNGVDINRSFPTDWTLGTFGTQTYGGTAPLTELEAQYIKSIFDANTDINIMYDFHNFFGSAPILEPATQFIWVTTSAGIGVQHLAQNLISRMSRKWQQEFAFIPSGTFIGYTDTSAGSQIQTYAHSLGIKYTGTFEVRDKWALDGSGDTYDQNVCKAGSEGIANWLLINIKDLLSRQ